MRGVSHNFMWSCLQILKNIHNSYFLETFIFIIRDGKKKIFIPVDNISHEYETNNLIEYLWIK